MKPAHRLVVATCLAVSLATGILNPALGQQGHNPFATPVEPGSGAWELVGQRDLGIQGELVALSPDGRHIAGIHAEGNRFCVWEVASGEATCDPERQPIVADSITWAPDSSAVAYALNALIFFYDSDIFVFEIDAGESVNLTDDGFDDGIPLGNDIELDELPVDVYPAWTPDGDSLVFARTEWLAEQPTTELMTVDRAGGPPEPLHTVRDDFPFAISSPIFPMSGGSILYSVFVNEFDDPGNGLWQLDTDGDPTQLLPGAEDETFPIATITDVRESPAGTLVSGYSRVLAGQLPIMAPIAFELDPGTGTVTTSAIEGEPGTYQTPFSYAPDGASRIAIESRQTERHLVITGPDGEKVDLGIHDGGRYVNSLGITWAENNTVLVPNLAQGGTLITLAPAS
jgi:hypothetical protein